jgi:hypothetical protein
VYNELEKGNTNFCARRGNLKYEEWTQRNRQVASFLEMDEWKPPQISIILAYLVVIAMKNITLIICHGDLRIWVGWEVKHLAEVQALC